MSQQEYGVRIPAQIRWETKLDSIKPCAVVPSPALTHWKCLHWSAVSTLPCGSPCVYSNSPCVLVHSTSLRPPRMAIPFTPVPFPVDWVSVSRPCCKRASPIHIDSSSANCEHSLPKSRGDGPIVDPTVDETCGRPRGGLTDGPSRQHRGEMSYGESWMERPISPTLLGHEILEERTKFTVGI